jgi:hypothetical protein
MKKETITVPLKPLKPRAPVKPTKREPSKKEIERRRQPKHRNTFTVCL